MAPVLIVHLLEKSLSIARLPQSSYLEPSQPWCICHSYAEGESRSKRGGSGQSLSLRKNFRMQNSENCGGIYANPQPAVTKMHAISAFRGTWRMLLVPPRGPTKAGKARSVTSHRILPKGKG